jgi:hypothetical protein
VIDWFARRAPLNAIRWSRWLLAGAAAFAILETGVLFARIVDDTTIRVPRLEAFAVSSATAVAVLGVWALGTAALMSDRWRVRAGWLAWVGAVSAGLLDRQTLAGEVVFLVAVFSFLHWLHAVLEHQDSAVGHAPLRVIQWQISVVFAWTAIAKLNPIFLSGGILWVAFDGPVPWPDSLRTQPVLMAMAVATVLFEMALAVGFWLRGLRRAAVVGAVLFHVFIVLFLSPTMALVAFALVMGTGYVLFAAEPWAAADRAMISQ